ncbi:Ribose 5-phosphate isomerase B [hydrothermal vent metagenome]|uniref:Ribose 5-phosphate isomerase B n=1 Tax=hydrothermal vent metagenome TaxID=652676 RepID=A0A3B0RVV9_9ZZZZ
MRIVVGSDHAGFPLKQELIPLLIEAGHEVHDVGTSSTDPVDYPDFAEATALALLDNHGERAIVICGSGAGACIAANKIRGIRCFQGNDTYTAHQAVEHDDANMVALAARVTGGALALEIAESFLAATFWDRDRYRRRLDKVLAIEDRNFRTDTDTDDRR